MTHRQFYRNNRRTRLNSGNGAFIIVGFRFKGDNVRVVVMPIQADRRLRLIGVQGNFFGYTLIKQIMGFGGKQDKAGGFGHVSVVHNH